MEHVGSRQGRAGPARHRGLRRHPRAHRAPAMGAQDSGGERLTAAQNHRPRLWGTPEVKDKQAEAGGGRSSTEWEAAPWHRWINKRGQQDRPKHSVVKSSKEVEQEIPGMQRNMAGAGRTLWHQEVMGTHRPQAQPGGDLSTQ